MGREPDAATTLRSQLIYRYDDSGFFAVPGAISSTWKASRFAWLRRRGQKANRECFYGILPYGTVPVSGCHDHASLLLGNLRLIIAYLLITLSLKRRGARGWADAANREKRFRCQCASSAPTAVAKLSLRKW